MPVTPADIDLNFTPDRVKKIRVLLGLTQEQFGAKVGVDGNMVSRWENGQAEPTRGPVLKKLLDVEKEAAGVA